MQQEKNGLFNKSSWVHGHSPGPPPHSSPERATGVCVQDLGLRGSLSNRTQKELTVRLHTVYENGEAGPEGRRL